MILSTVLLAVIRKNTLCFQLVDLETSTVCKSAAIASDIHMILDDKKCRDAHHDKKKEITYLLSILAMMDYTWFKVLHLSVQRYVIVLDPLVSSSGLKYCYPKGIRDVGRSCYVLHHAISAVHSYFFPRTVT